MEDGYRRLPSSGGMSLNARCHRTSHRLIQDTESIREPVTESLCRQSIPALEPQQQISKWGEDLIDAYHVRQGVVRRLGPSPRGLGLGRLEPPLRWGCRPARSRAPDLVCLPCVCTWVLPTTVTLIQQHWNEIYVATVPAASQPTVIVKSQHEPIYSQY